MLCVRGGRYRGGEDRENETKEGNVKRRKEKINVRWGEMWK